jgi:hypothetical protein
VPATSDGTARGWTKTAQDAHDDLIGKKITVRSTRSTASAPLVHSQREARAAAAPA